MAQEVFRINQPKPDVIVPRTANVVAWHGPTGLPICEEVVTKHVREDVPDKAGNPTFRTHPVTGDIISRIGRLKTVEITERYMLVPSPKMHVRKQYDFEPDPEDVKRLETQAALEEFRAQMELAAVERGVTGDQFLEALMGEANLPDAPVEATGPVHELGKELEEKVVDVENVDVLLEPGDYPISRGGGNWILSNGEKFKGSTAAADATEAALQAG